MMVSSLTHSATTSAPVRKREQAQPGPLDQFQPGDQELQLIKPMYPLVGGAIPEEQLPLMMEALPGWSLRRVDGLPRLEREFPFPDFKQAMEFSNQLAELAETQGHHPTLLTEWGKVTVGWWTHDVGGVHANDFLSARRSEARFRTGRSSEAPGTAQN